MTIRLYRPDLLAPNSCQWIVANAYRSSAALVKTLGPKDWPAQSLSLCLRVTRNLTDTVLPQRGRAARRRQGSRSQTSIMTRCGADSADCYATATCHSRHHPNRSEHGLPRGRPSPRPAGCAIKKARAAAPCQAAATARRRQPPIDGPLDTRGAGPVAHIPSQLQLRRVGRRYMRPHRSSTTTIRTTRPRPLLG